MYKQIIPKKWNEMDELEKELEESRRQYFEARHLADKLWPIQKAGFYISMVVIPIAAAIFMNLFQNEWGFFGILLGAVWSFVFLIVWIWLMAKVWFNE